MTLNVDVRGARYALFLGALIAIILGSGAFAVREFAELAAGSPGGEYAVLPSAKAEPSYRELPDGAVILSSQAAVAERKEAFIRGGDDFIFADLEAMELTVFRGGEPAKTVPIRAKGREGSFFETPSGIYSVRSKETDHFSSIGKVWMPWSMHVFGNYFIHGWPYYPDGRPVPEGFSGGCIRLSTADAAGVFSLARPGMTVLVSAGGEKPAADFAYFRKVSVAGDSFAASLGARSALAADLETGKILFEKERRATLPIASITKLMTALVTLEAVNRYRLLTVSAQDLAAFGDAGLSAGETFESQDLLYPLILASSNDAASVYERSAWRLVELMNEKARAIGLAETHFADASGISPENVSSTEDLFRLLRFLYRNKKPLFEISGLFEKTLVSASGREHRWTNVNWAAEDSRYLGGKTGKTREAGETIAAAFSVKLAEFGERPVAVILLGSPDRARDAELTLTYLEENFVYGTTFTKDKANAPGIPSGAAIYEAVESWQELGE